MNKNYDRRGEEINYKVNMAVEEPDIENCYKEYDNENRYDECMKDDLTCSFKIGDEVITSTGEIGRIVGICTCDLCKGRGFYEPQVEFTIGGAARYISNNDKKDNFRSYYKIGDKIFGNIDEDEIKNRINKLQIELIDLDLQLNVINSLKKKNEITFNEEN